MEQAPAYPESSQNYEKSAQIEEQLTNNVDEMPKSVEEYPEALPEPLPLSSGLKPQNYKKSGPIYRTFEDVFLHVNLSLLINPFLQFQI